MTRIIFTLAIWAFCISSFAADYYWVGGSGNWSQASTHWATTDGGTTFYSQAPSEQDNVFFTENSFTAPNQKVTLNIDANCRNMDWRLATNEPIFDFAAGKSIELTGALKLIDEMSLEGENTWYFRASLSAGATNQISCGENSLTNMIFDDEGLGGSWQLTKNVQAANIIHEEGSLYTNDQYILTDYFTTISPKPRVLSIGNSTIVCTKRWEAARNSSGFYIQTGIDAQIFTAHLKSSILAYNKVLLFTASDGNTKLEGTGNQFGELYLETETVTEIYGNHTFISKFVFLNKNSTVLFEPGTKQTFTGEIIAPMPCGNMVRIGSLVRGEQFTWEKNIGSVVNFSYFQIEDSRASGPVQFKTILSINGGNNSGWIFNTPLSPKTYYWVGGGGGWSDPSHWSDESGGAPIYCIPTLVDDVFFDENSFPMNNPDKTVRVDHRNIAARNLDFSAVTNNPTFDLTFGVDHPYLAKTVSLSGSLRLSPNMTLLEDKSLWSFEATSGSHEIHTKNHTLANMELRKSGTYTLMDKLTLTGNLLQEEGIFDTNGKNIIANSFISKGAKNRGLALNDSEIRITGLAEFTDVTGNELLFDAGTSLIFASSLKAYSKTFNEVRIQSPTGGVIHGADFTFDILRINTALPTIVEGNNTYNTLLKINNPGVGVIFEEGTTQKLNGDLEIASNCSDMTMISSSNTSTTVGNTNFVVFETQPSSPTLFTYLDIMAVKVTGGAFYVAYNSNYIPANQVASSGWFLGQGDCELPVELTSFEANRNRNVVDLNWTTATEINTEHFSVQRSQDGVDYLEIGRLPAKGNSTETVNYSYTDRNPLNGSNYYRLKIQDFDGTVDFSDTRLVKFDYAVADMIKLFPNPANDNLQLEFHLEETMEVAIDVVDVQGKQVMGVEAENIAAGNQVFSYDLAGLTSGVYIVNVWVGPYQIRKKFVKI